MINKWATVSNQQLNPPIPPLPKGGKGGFEAGFTMIELLVSMVMFVFVIAAASQIFTAQLTQFKQQSKIAETNIEGIIGLELLRRDIKHAGYGLPWDMNGANYNEADDNFNTFQDETDYNDSTANDPPRALISGNDEGVNGTDVLVIKATNVAINEASKKWTHLYTGNTVREWTPDGERLETSDRVIVISPGTNRELQLNVASFTTRYDANPDPTPDTLMDDVFAPFSGTGTRLVYGVTLPASPVDTPLRMPFNRADYYVRTPVAASFPDRCATGTGILYKATVNQGDGTTAGGGLSELPVLDCVADIQVVYRLDTTGDGTINTPSNDISALTAQDIRAQVKEVRVYILAHEGQRDPNFTFTRLGPVIYPGACATCIRVGPATGEGRDFNLTTVADFADYRWKIYTIVVIPENLG